MKCLLTCAVVALRSRLLELMSLLALDVARSPAQETELRALTSQLDSKVCATSLDSLTGGLICVVQVVSDPEPLRIPLRNADAVMVSFSQLSLIADNLAGPQLAQVSLVTAILFSS